jgi:hypothetical protein
MAPNGKASRRAERAVKRRAEHVPSATVFCSSDLRASREAEPRSGDA